MLRELKRLINKLKEKKSPEKFQSLPQDTSTFVQTQLIDYHLSVPTNSAFTANVPLTVAGVNQMTVGEGNDAVKGPKSEDARITKRPVEIVAEIIAPIPQIQSGAIKKQIKIVENRLKILKKVGGNTSDEAMALRYLKSRRYYEKYKKLFPWAITTTELIDKLLNSYKVQKGSLYSYSKNLPMEATIELEKFATAWDKVVDDDKWKPDIKLIVDYDGPEHKKDPILYASSPFGNWYYVLGAWDKEVEIVDDIIYKGK